MKNQKNRRVFDGISVYALIIMFVFAISSLSAQTESRQLSSFNKIELAGAYKVILAQGGGESINIEASEADKNNLITNVENGTLKIYQKKDSKTHDEITLTIHFKNLEEIESSGAIKMESVSSLNFHKLDLELSGAASLNLDLNADAIDVDISGSGKAEFKGNAKNVELNISGTGKYDANNLVTENCEISISGVGNAVVNVKTSLEVQISGTGTVSYKGEPSVKQEISGMGSLKKI